MQISRTLSKETDMSHREQGRKDSGYVETGWGWEKYLMDCLLDKTSEMLCTVPGGDLLGGR